MNVLGHDNIGPQVELPVFTRFLNRIGQAAARSLALEKRKTSIATKGQLVCVTGVIEVFAMLGTHSGDGIAVDARRQKERRTRIVWGLRYAATPATRGRSILALDFFREQIPSSHSPRVEKERSNKETRKVAQIEFDRLVNCFVTNPDSNRRENYENASD